MKNKLIKLISLILCVLMISPLFACDNGNNDESNNPPPEAPQEQTNFYNEVLNLSLPKLYCYEEFDNVEAAKKYAKTWKKDYELYLPIIEADNIAIEFLTFRSGEEKEKFCHKIEFKYTNAQPFYEISGATSLYESGKLDKTEFYVETKDNGVVENVKTNYYYFYRDDGRYGSTYDLESYRTYKVGVICNNFLFLDTYIQIDKNESKTPEELKTLVLDNIVPREEQKYKDKEISTNLKIDVEVLIASPLYEPITHDNYASYLITSKYLGNYFNHFSFGINESGFEKINYVSKPQFYPWYYSFTSYSDIIRIELNQTNDKTVYVNLESSTKPISLLYEEDSKTYEYQMLINKEEENGYRIIIKNGYTNIFYGTIKSENKADINVKEVGEKLLSNIILIKPE